MPSSFKCAVFIKIISRNAASCANQRQYFILVHRNAELLEQRVLSQKNIPQKAKTIVMFAHVQEPNGTQLEKELDQRIADNSAHCFEGLE